MKIICFHNNYPHLNQIFSKEEVPIFYLKPDTSILTNNRPFFIPECTEDIHCQVELVIRINKLGKYIQEKYANTYYHQIALGVNIFDNSIRNQCIQKGFPWESSTIFENSAALSNFFPLDSIDNFKMTDIKLIKNEQEIFTGNISNMIFSVEKLIAYISQYFTLKTGDLLFTGSPIPSVPIHINDVLEVYTSNEKRLRFRIK